MTSSVRPAGWLVTSRGNRRSGFSIGDEMRNISDMKDAGLTVLQMCELATNERLDAVTLESICAEAAVAIRKRDSMLLQIAADLQNEME